MASSFKVKPSPEQQLIAQIRAGDAAAYRRLFDQHYPAMLGTAIHMLRDKEVARDVVQDVLMRIWNNRAKLEIRTSLGAYLKRAVINGSLNQLEKRKKLVGEEKLEREPVRETDALEQLEFQDLQTALNHALDELPDRCRSAFVMKRLEGLSVKEIAKEMEISPKTVENQITKAIRHVSAALQSFRTGNKNKKPRGDRGK